MVGKSLKNSDPQKFETCLVFRRHLVYCRLNDGSKLRNNFPICEVIKFARQFVGNNCKKGTKHEALVSGNNNSGGVK